MKNYLKLIKDMTLLFTLVKMKLKYMHIHLFYVFRSQYFRAAFSDEWANKKDGKFILNKPNISPQILTIILRFIYCGRINLTELQGPEILKLLIAVD
ncbi:BTB/POZ protein [Rhizophagus irregularis DAOM 181602=DAOM 197198]|uniref:BTB domain-containing protein n=1 Tax=Rhizophagus irregularis (strain DAOM 181602 / DAOM 197198 / MUCL 43194) TaxID=747089 RepID=A0A2P4PDL7_RHIID|nr:hypothetical protein GLOIN_2v1882103 [Rhizophagus irregularis DAOM 181602=DAOM 197198]POG63484.1 hypothetical protein GLOIN_2v1882103 [Rhizophagus irregularis DAOM 181602=DAOM 197198]GET65595.1 BTB/POZ protein [Rhizophagus irregularis DAOM 181602=DAOM 197198]|eukprot:XP_025170350.1 hypothetical protein GLOIN_2v1882103 [Rhizophagus irregularis DAOM 181602=DAOM 197198]